MMESEIRTIRYGNGEIQRYQIARGFSWDDICPVHPPFSIAAFNEICRIYSAYMIPGSRKRHGAVVLFLVPEDILSPFPATAEAGTVLSQTLSAAIYLNRLSSAGRIRRSGCTVETADTETAAFLSRLSSAGFLSIACGDLDDVSFIPVSGAFGFINSASDACLAAVNSHFFLMDPSDIDSPYDMLETPFGLLISGGIVLQPPLYGREALAVDKSGRSMIIRPDLRELGIELQGRMFRHGENCIIYSRPECRITDPSEGTDVVIIGRDAVAYHRGGMTAVPMGGFVLSTYEPLEEVRSEVTYHGLGMYDLAIQAGPCAVRDFEKTDRFMSSFYDAGRDSVPYPPAVYPLGYGSDRAPRMLIAADKDDEPLLIWAEGCSKLGYRAGEESRGMTLLETAELCCSLGLRNAVNLDGGGSAEMLIDGMMHMDVSARFPDGAPSERPVPLGLIVR